MSFAPSERAFCRFLTKNDTEKSKTLKLLPSVVNGPWIVQRAVGGKPVIIGNKLPVSCTYQPANESLHEAAYLEVDIDIVSSATARGILSIVKHHTQSLVIDLGFVIEAQHNDELPEQMLCAVRFHGITCDNPMIVPNYPMMPILQSSNEGDDIFDHPLDNEV